LEVRIQTAAIRPQWVPIMFEECPLHFDQHKRGPVLRIGDSVRHR
jgi:hypothetical protein